MPLCSVWIVNKFVNNSFEKKESKKIFTRIIWGLFILIQIVMETEKGNVSIQKGIISFFVILGIIIIGYKGTFQRKLLFTSLFISIWILSEFFVYFILNIYNFEEDTMQEYTFSEDIPAGIYQGKLTINLSNIQR